MKPIFRNQFLDQTWDSKDLERAALWWMLLHEAWARQNEIRYSARLTIEIKLTCFSKLEGGSLKDELERRLMNSEMTQGSIVGRDPDAIVFSLKKIGKNNAASVGQVLSILSGQSFDGLAIEVRFRLNNRELLSTKHKKQLPTELFVIGQLHQDGLLVKGLIRDFPNGSNRSECRQNTTMRDDELLQAAFREFRESGEIANESVRKTFKSPAAIYIQPWMLWLNHVPFDQPRLLALILRCFVIAIVIACISSVFYFSILHEMWITLVLLALLGWFALLLVLPFVFMEIRFLLWYRLIRNHYANHYSELDRYQVLKPEESVHFSGDPLIRMYTKHLTAAGFIHAGDVAKGPIAESPVITRIFMAPDNVTYFSLVGTKELLIYPKDQAVEGAKKSPQRWPMVIVFQAQTIFSSGGHFRSLTPCTFSFWRPHVGADTVIRIVSTLNDPVDFIRSHVEAVESFARERDFTPLPQKRFDDHVHHLEFANQENQQHYLNHPYSWLNHIRWYLQWPRKEYRG